MCELAPEPPVGGCSSRFAAPVLAAPAVLTGWQKGGAGAPIGRTSLALVGLGTRKRVFGETLFTQLSGAQPGTGHFSTVELMLSLVFIFGNRCRGM